MNINVYYKGEVVQIDLNGYTKIEQLYEVATKKFNLHFSQELFLLKNNVRLRNKRTNNLIKFDDVAKDKLINNDTIVIEPDEKTLAPSSQNCHAPKRYQLDNIDNSSIHKPLDNINELILPIKTRSRVPHELKSGSHKYQKSDQTNRHSQNITNYFDRNTNGLRRSVGAAIAPQFDLPYVFPRQISNDQDHSSDSSISDFGGGTKDTKSPSHSSHGQNDVTDHSNSNNKHTKSPSARHRPSNFKEGRVRNHPNSNSTNTNISSTISKSVPTSPDHSNLRIPQTNNVPSHQITPKSAFSQPSHLTSHNVRTIGDKIELDIIKKPIHGLGFTIATRDNHVIYSDSSDEVILVNKILPNGGAVETGELKTGDRILKVNGQQMRSLKEATNTLRSINEGTNVKLLISRVAKKTEDEYTTTSSQFQKDSPTKSVNSPDQQVTYRINLPPHQTNYQLGIQIQDNSSNSNTDPQNNSVSIHSVIQDSLAQTSGLSTGDIIVAVNEQSTMGMNAAFITELLRIALTQATATGQNKHINISVIKKKTNIPKYKPNSHMQILPNKMSVIAKHRSRRKPTNIEDQDCSWEDDFTPNPESFSREARGRRSMSEKRKGHDDATKYQFYQATRLGADSNSDRLYNTLPIQLHKKKSSQNNTQQSHTQHTTPTHHSNSSYDIQYPPPPPLPAKSSTATPVRPSHIKQMNNNNQQLRNNSSSPSSETRRPLPPPPPVPPLPLSNKVTATNVAAAPRTPIRSVSLRSSPDRKSYEAQSTKRYSQLPKSFEESPTTVAVEGTTSPNNPSTTPFNRAMNNSFKRAVHKTIQPTNSNNKQEQFTDNLLVTKTPLNYDSQIINNSSNTPTATTSTNTTPVNFNHIQPQPQPQPPKLPPPRSNSLKYPILHDNSRSNQTPTTPNSQKKPGFTFKAFASNVPTHFNTAPRSKSANQTALLNTVNSVGGGGSGGGGVDPTYLPHSYTGPPSGPSNNPIIEDSRKRVLDWQRKNADFMATPQPIPAPPPPAAAPPPTSNNKEPSRLVYQNVSASSQHSKSSPKTKQIVVNHDDDDDKFVGDGRIATTSKLLFCATTLFRCCTINRKRKGESQSTFQSPKAVNSKIQYPIQYEHANTDPYESLGKKDYNTSRSTHSKNNTPTTPNHHHNNNTNKQSSRPSSSPHRNQTNKKKSTSPPKQTTRPQTTTSPQKSSYNNTPISNKNFSFFNNNKKSSPDLIQIQNNTNNTNKKSSHKLPTTPTTTTTTTTTQHNISSHNNNNSTKIKNKNKYKF